MTTNRFLDREHKALMEGIKVKVGRYVEVEYGPKDPNYKALGKFQCEFDERVHDLTMDGCCESVGEADFTGWFAKVPLTDEDHEYLKTDTFPEMFEPNTNRRPVGAIVEVVNSGAVYVSYYYTDVDFDSVWGQICDEKLSWLNPDDFKDK